MWYDPILRIFRKKPQPFAPPPVRSLRASLEGEAPPAAPPPPDVPQMPEGVDLAALWEEPQEASLMTTIFSGIAAFSAALILILKLFGH